MATPLAVRQCLGRVTVRSRFDDLRDQRKIFSVADEPTGTDVGRRAFGLNEENGTSDRQLSRLFSMVRGVGFEPTKAFATGS